jgi:hypothetical protein
MGISLANPSFIAQSQSGTIQLSQNLPYAGSVVPIGHNNSGIVAHLDATALNYGCLMGGINGDERRLPSELDILINAQISGYTVMSLNPQPGLQLATAGWSTGIQSISLKRTTNTSGKNRPAVVRIFSVRQSSLLSKTQK